MCQPQPRRSSTPSGSVRSAQVVLSCAELQPSVDFFVERLGFRLERISPADDPRAASLSGHGLQVLLRRGSAEAPSTLRLECDDPRALGGGARELTAPNGTRIELAESGATLASPTGRQELVVRRASDAGWVRGRAGMRYRDLLPGRLGGRFVASHIHIVDGGPVPDQVHFHAIRFQMIYCVAGRVRVVYEDQGPPFVLEEGDCVLQPPRIRHRVLECSPGLEVVEIACPAEHDTFFDHELALPTPELCPERAYDGQHFVRHRAVDARWHPWRLAGFECRDLGLEAATAGLAGARVVRAARASASAGPWGHDGELLFAFVLAGELTLEGATPDPLRLKAADTVAVPAGCECTLAACSADLQLLEVRLPGAT